ncbi:hypothetical protein M1112_01435 [Candidatus Parvarchaeota archaeon]|nr:hypothetical protein [Candidatus Parvarchaeota archaeon]
MVKGQSALEYVMTYGWAILIIVVVAVVLYSMGVFNPRNTVTPTSTGFAPFSISSAICNSSGLVVSMSALFNGNIEYAYLNKFYFTSAVGTSITSGVYNLNNVEITKNIPIIINIPQIKCSSPHVVFSLSL